MKKVKKVNSFTELREFSNTNSMDGLSNNFLKVEPRDPLLQQPTLKHKQAARKKEVTLSHSDLEDRSDSMLDLLS